MKVEIDTKFLQEKYGLKEAVRIAFSDKTARRKQLEWWINREEELEEWRKIIMQSVSLERNHMVFIIGSYGRGKTLSLLKVIDEAEKHDEICICYLNFKGEEKSKSGLDFLLRVFRSIDFSKLKIGKTAEELRTAIKSIPGALGEPRSILEKIFLDKSDSYQQELFSVKELGQRSSSELGKLALFFLRGEIKPSPSQLRRLGIMRRIDTVDIAKEYLSAILSFIKALGYKTLLLAIDEFEYLFSLVPKSQHSIYIALLRSLYDFPTGLAWKPGDVANMTFFISISEDGWDNLKEMEKREASIGGPTVPLLDRVDAKTTLGVFDRNHTRELIVKRLKYNRIAHKFENQPLIPFTEDFVDYIYKQTDGEPRAIVVRCGQVLDAGLADRVPLLNRDFAQRVLEERGF